MIDLAILVLASLFSVVNPLGAIPVYLALTTSYTRQERNRSSLAISIYFVLILLTFFLAGSYILSFFGISLSSLKIAGGLVIFNSGFALLNGKFESNRVNKKVKTEAKDKEDISFAPMAMPMLSGPGSISLLISLFAENKEILDRVTIASTVLIMGLIVFLILKSAPLLFRFLGHSGLKAISRIMGFIVMAIAVEYIVSGIISLVAQYN